MASLLSRLAPLVITLRGSKRGFSTAQRTLDSVARLQRKPKSFAPPSRLTAKVDVARRDVDGWPVFSLSPKGRQPDTRAIYLHGGCYVYEIDPVHWTFIANLAVEAGITVIVPIMPLAPAGTASVVVPAVADLAASLIAEVGAENLSIIGDSSGGGMSLAVAMELRDRELPPLHRTVLIAPWLDISGTDPMLAVIAPTDPWLAVPGTHAAGKLYRDELGEGDWRVSPLHGDLTGLGPITMFSGTRDIVHADAMRFLPLAAEAGLEVDYHEGQGMLHNYPILPMPEGDAARMAIVAAIR
ncbi:alpha/beta hydrolase [Salinibacterium sp. G-O1]|uniref:alpha/beta hydrolase fold domain-containing protein n=1 Tax=Salinibacterium sp. G-O1 TaxID=3046208 RepID=UPI0024B95404|nr:alpha/beta hydrolase [Salinibacterium sp. G-O1]MDJ0335529.1 alpha/beta hydrolase [Salinibacterium sp. G-O1]